MRSANSFTKSSQKLYFYWYGLLMIRKMMTSMVQLKKITICAYRFLIRKASIMKAILFPVMTIG